MRHPSRSPSAGSASPACSRRGSPRGALPGSLPPWRCGSSMLQDLRALPISSESFARKSACARSERGPMLGNVVTGDAFRVRGAAPALGRTLLPEDATLPYGEPVLVLSYDAWRGKFGGDSGVIG